MEQKRTERSGHYHRTTNANLGFQASYNYQHKYYADFSAAMPYSTKLPEGNRTAFSPTVTLGWNLAKEDFMGNSIFDNLMLTASVGIINQDLDITTSDNEDGYFLYQPVVQPGGWMIPTVLEKCGYERQEEGMIPTVLEKRGYERQEEGMIPMAFEKRGYERQEETEIPSLLRKYGDMQYNNRRENHMFANYWEIQNRVKYIKEELSHIEAVEKEMPAGELIVAKNNKNYKWYFHNQNTTIYLPKKEIELAKKLTLKKYYQLRKEELQRELQACQMYMQKADCKKDMLEKMLDNEEYERLLGGRRHSVKKELENWMNEKYEKNGSHPENLIVKGTQGKFLRSKSEAIIDKVFATTNSPAGISFSTASI